MNDTTYCRHCGQLPANHDGRSCRGLENSRYSPGTASSVRPARRNRGLPQHDVVAVEDKGHPLIVVRCSCGFWQQKTRPTYSPSLWLSDAFHLAWTAQQAQP